MIKFLRLNKNLSVVDVIPKLVKSCHLKDIAEAIQDPRDIFEEAGKYFSGGHEKLLLKVSKKIDIELYLELEVETLLSISHELPIEKLQKLACFPIVTENRVTALVAVDPVAAKKSLEIPDDFPVYLCNWQRIKKAWESLVLFRNQHSSEVQKVKENEKQRGKVVLCSLLENFSTIMSKQQAKSIDIICDPVNPSYMLYNEGGDLLSGKIASEIHKIAWTYLCNNYQDSSFLEMINENYSVIISVDTKNLKWKITTNNYLPTQEKISENITEETKIAADKSLSESKPPENTKTIMLIDDSSIFCEVLKRYLCKEDYKLNSYSLPKKALHNLASNSEVPNLIISDLHMPDYSGEDILKKIRLQKKLAKIPFILLTSDNAINTKLKFIEAGVDAFICKNEDPRLIAAQVKSLLNKSDECCIQH